MAEKRLPVLRRELQGIMWDLGGIARSRPGLDRALVRVTDIAQEVGHSSGHEPSLQELRFATRAAQLVLEAARRREESRGPHWREDHPDTDDRRWLGHLLVRRSADGGETWHFESCTDPEGAPGASLGKEPF